MCSSDLPFLIKHLAFAYFWSESIENVYADSKHVEVVWYEVSCGYAALIEIYVFSKVVPFLDHSIYCESRFVNILKSVRSFGVVFLTSRSREPYKITRKVTSLKHLFLMLITNAL